MGQNILRKSRSFHTAWIVPLASSVDPFNPFYGFPMSFSSANTDSRKWLGVSIFLGYWLWLLVTVTLMNAWPRPFVIINDAGIAEPGIGSLIPWECIDSIDITYLNGCWSCM